MADEAIGIYHVCLWEPPVSGGEPPSYVCQVCVGSEAQRLTEEAVQAHIRNVHHLTPMASDSTAPILALYAQDAAAIAAAQAAPAAPETTAPAQEETDAGSDV